MYRGKNSNKADAQGESFVDMLSTETPCLYNPLISYYMYRYLKEGRL